jgi:hypothetical protein
MQVREDMHTVNATIGEEINNNNLVFKIRANR